MAGIEKYIAIASLGLFAMFVGEVNVFYNYLTNPNVDTDPEAKLLMYISIGVAPAAIMAGTAFIMSKRYGSRQIGGLIVTGGIILFVGMLVANSTVPKVDANYRIYTVEIVPPLFMAVAVAVIGAGGFLFRTKKRPIKEFF
ncbi:MAG: hypothetical protein QXN55_02830 [Candidatus Nitrosotenuis sp.]|jgi:hypothetical protein